jgi:hypothetical protein
MTSGRSGRLLIDAYAAQHPGDSSPQATQSVAVHLIVLQAILGHGDRHEDAIRIRVAAVEYGRKHNGYPNLEPDPPVWHLTIQDVADAPDADERGEVAARYVERVWSSWRKSHGETIADWHTRAWRG